MLDPDKWTPVQMTIAESESTGKRGGDDQHTITKENGMTATDQPGTAHIGQHFSRAAKLGFRLFAGLHAAAYRLTGGRFGGSMSAAPILVLHTTGRQSGKERATPLLYLADGEDLVVVASMGGAARNPGWWHNLRGSPEARVQLGPRSLRVRARDAEGAECDRLWAQLAGMFPRYDEYQRATTRPIPVVILRPIEGMGAPSRRLPHATAATSRTPRGVASPASFHINRVGCRTSSIAALVDCRT